MKCRLRLSVIGILGAVVLFFGAGSGHAVPLIPFTCITNNIAGDCAIGVAQLSGSVVDFSTGIANLEIVMTGAANAVVEQVFIESSIVTGASFIMSTGLGIVVFTVDGSPGNFPGGNQPAVAFMVDVSVSADPPPPKNGIGRHPTDNFSPQSGLFKLTYTGNFVDLLSDLRVGVHVIGYTTDGSESFVSAPIPEPSTLLLLASGLAGLGFFRIRRKAA